MRRSGLFLLLGASLATGFAGSDASRPKLSEHVRREITAKLPIYTPPPPASADQAPVEPDPDVLVLSKVVVTEKRPPGNDPDDWLSDSTVQKKAMVAYKTSMTDLEWALNGWFIPLVTAPPSARARIAYREAKITAEKNRLSAVIQAIHSIDPKEAARLNRELTRPADSLPSSAP